MSEFKNVNVQKVFNCFAVLFNLFATIGKINDNQMKKIKNTYKMSSINLEAYVKVIKLLCNQKLVPYFLFGEVHKCDCRK